MYDSSCFCTSIYPGLSFVALLFVAYKFVVGVKAHLLGHIRISWQTLARFPLDFFSLIRTVAIALSQLLTWCELIQGSLLLPFR